MAVSVNSPALVSPPQVPRNLVTLATRRFGCVRSRGVPQAPNCSNKGSGSNGQQTESSAPIGRLMRLRDVVREYQVSAATLRAAHRRGELEVLQLPSSHRRFSRQSIERWLGVSEKSTRPLIVGVVRVSTTQEKQDSSIVRQRAEIEAYCLREFGRKPDVWNERRASGLLFSHPKFLELVENLTNGSYRGGVIVATYPDRIARQGRELIEHLARVGGCEIRYIYREEPKDFAEQISEDILAYMTSVCNRNSGMKAKKVLECQISPECLKEFFLLKRAGYSNRYSAEQVYQKGFRDERNDKRLHHNVLYKRVMAQWDGLNALYAEEGKKLETSFGKFLKEKVRRSKERVGVTAERLNERYQEWCREKKQEPISQNQVGRVLGEMGLRKVDNTEHKIEWRGIILL